MAACRSWWDGHDLRLMFAIVVETSQLKMGLPNEGRWRGLGRVGEEEEEVGGGGGQVYLCYKGLAGVMMMMMLETNAR